MKRILTVMSELITIALVGETEAGSVEVQPARDSQLKATNCRWDGSYTPAIPFYEQGQFRAFLCLKKPPCRRQGSLLTVLDSHKFLLPFSVIGRRFLLAMSY